mgnify:CR=1 FL=1
MKNITMIIIMMVLSSLTFAQEVANKEEVHINVNEVLTDNSTLIELEENKKLRDQAQSFTQFGATEMETRIESDIKKLVSFGTRHTLSDTLSNTTGIGAARRWIKKSFKDISTKDK